MLRAENIDIGYPKKGIAKDINVSIALGKMVCLLGQNGVGKSTFLRTLANIQKPLNGNITLFDKNILELTPNELARKLGFISTKKMGVANMKVRELVELGRYPYTDWLGRETAEDKLNIERAISRCRIDFIQNSRLGEISDGQYQKTMLARVLAQNTDFIVMDEPTAHLDVVNRQEIFQLLSHVKQESNKGLLISTHELDLSVMYADELWLMDFNKPMVTGSPKELLDSGALQKIFTHGDITVDLSYLDKKIK